MEYTFTHEEVKTILLALDVASGKYDADLEGGWIDDEDEAQEMLEASTAMSKLWATTFKKFTEGCREMYGNNAE